MNELFRNRFVNGVCRWNVYCYRNNADISGDIRMSKWNDIKRELFASYPMCRLCMIRPAVHLHHAVINKGKVRNKKLHKYLDHKYNALEVCEKCHLGADSYQYRQRAYQINCDRYGKEEMKEWYDNLPFKIKEKL